MKTTCSIMIAALIASLVHAQESTLSTPGTPANAPIKVPTAAAPADASDIIQPPVEAPPDATPKAESPSLSPEELGRKASAILTQHCYRCHAQKKVAGVDLDVRSADGLGFYVVAGDLESSTLFDEVKSNRMPKGNTKLNRQEIEILEQWILSGAEYPAPDERTFLTELDILTAIEQDLDSLDRADVNDTRYLSLAHLHNNASVKDWELRLFRAAISKTVNSLNPTKPAIVMPVAVDEAQTIFRIDLRDYGWSRADWRNLLDSYPYGLVFTSRDIKEVREEIDDLFGGASQNRLPYIRADWFVATATRPPFYNQFLDLPDTADALEEKLGVDVEQNILSGKAGREIARAGFTESAVSVGNRLVERHTTPQGAYWKSYDFQLSNNVPDKKRNLFTHPLGPRFANNPFDDFAFDHDGGEMIFNLPNGLQGYYLTTADDAKLDVGPIEVVRDKDEVSGTPQVVNGISCISCHDRGMKDFEDAVRVGFAGGADSALDKVNDLFLPNEEMQKLVQQDRARFKEAVLAATGPFLLVAEDKDKDIFDFEEPVKKLVLRYSEDLTVEEVAAELGRPDPDKVRNLMKTLQDIGLGPVAHNRTIKRQFWDSRDGGASLFQQAAVDLDIAIEADN